MKHIKKINKIRTGGQTGVDRAAMDVARKYGIPLCGWCPKNGWAEDYPFAPGLLKDYPELSETPSEGTSQRTEWNMRDADAILTIIPDRSLPSPGTDVGLTAGEILGKPMLTISGIEDVPRILEWLNSLSDGIELCIGGPRASECSMADDTAREILFVVFNTILEAEMENYCYITLRERPDLKETTAQWFHGKFGVPSEAYLECMEAYLSEKTEYGWYLCLEGDQIVGGIAPYSERGLHFMCSYRMQQMKISCIRK